MYKQKYSSICLNVTYLSCTFFLCLNNAAVHNNELKYTTMKKTKHMVNKLEWLSKKLRLNALIVYLVLFETLTKMIYHSFNTVCRTLNQN